MACPFGFSVADLAKAIKLARDIYVNCFTEGQGANLKYRQLLNDIQVLENSLKRLQDVVKRSEELFPRLEWNSDATSFGTAELWSQLTGDFCQTLQECGSLLNRYHYLRNGRTNVAYNFRWWRSAESNVDNLMAKLKYHIAKVEFYAKPSEFNSIVRNGSQIQQLRRQVANLEQIMINGTGSTPTLWATFLSDELKAKFDSEFNKNRPVWLVQGSEWPLKDGLAAMDFHFARSTVKFNPTQEYGKIPSLSQYLHLVRSIWILEQIKQSDRFQAACPESFWAGYMSLEDALRAQLHRFGAGELDKPSAQDLLGLDDCFYSIGKSEQINSDMLEVRNAGPLEEKILEIDLPSDASNRRSALLVFRENEADFRLVISTKQADTLVAQHDQEVEVNMDRNWLVPAYSNPIQGPSPRNNILLFDANGRKSKEFAFLNPADVRKFQRALTGYRVHHDMPIARWCINGSKQEGDSGEGILQLWQFKPLPPMSVATPSEVSDTNSSVGSPRSPAVSGFTLTSQGSIMSHIQGSRRGSTELSKPELPVLIIFTQCNHKYSFLHLTLDTSIQIQPNSCGCRNPNRHCTRVILESKKPFTIRMQSADQEGEQGLKSWDLSVFRYPRPEKFNKTTVKGKVKFLELDFTDEDRKDEFLRELVLLENVRSTNQNDYEKCLRDKKKQVKF